MFKMSWSEQEQIKIASYQEANLAYKTKLIIGKIVNHAVYYR